MSRVREIVTGNSIVTFVSCHTDVVVVVVVFRIVFLYKLFVKRRKQFGKYGDTKKSFKKVSLIIKFVSNKYYLRLHGKTETRIFIVLLDT